MINDARELIALGYAEIRHGFSVFFDYSSGGALIALCSAVAALTIPARRATH
jgi:hypothetical protein